MIRKSKLENIAKEKKARLRSLSTGKITTLRRFQITKAQLTSLQFVDNEIKRLQHRLLSCKQHVMHGRAVKLELAQAE